MQSLSTTHYLQLALRESGMYENTGWALPKGSLDSKSATGCTQIELAKRSTRSTKPRRKIILGPIKRLEELRWNLEERSWLQNSWHTTFDNWTAGYNTWEQGQQVDREVREPQHKESFLQDLSQTQKINKQSKELQELLAGMNNTESFELRENSSKQHCPECNTYWEIEIIQCNCGRKMKSSQRPPGFEQNNYAVTSIPWQCDQEERTAVVLPNTDLLKDKECTTKRNRCWKMHVRKSTENTQRYCHEIGWKEKDIMLFDRIVLEKQLFVAKRAERIQNSKHWILTLNAKGPRQPLNQRPDFAQAKRECKRLHDKHLAKTQQDNRTIPRSQQVRQRKEQPFEGIEESNYAFDPKTSWKLYTESRGNLPTASSSSSNWDRTHWKTSQLELSAFFKVWRFGFGCLEKTPGGVNSTLANTARAELHNMITFHHANTRGSRVGRLRIAHLSVLEQLSSTRHVSFLASPDTDHKHKFSLTYLTYLSDNLTNTHKTFGTRPMFTLRSSRAEWRINTKPISYNACALDEMWHTTRNKCACCAYGEVLSVQRTNVILHQPFARDQNREDCPCESLHLRMQPQIQ